MIKIEGNDIWRNGQKVGWIDSNHIRAHDGVKLGYFEGNYVHSNDGEKIAYIDGAYLHQESGGTKVSLDKVNEEIVGGLLPEIGKCAIYVLIGI